MWQPEHSVLSRIKAIFCIVLILALLNWALLPFLEFWNIKGNAAASDLRSQNKKAREWFNQVVFLGASGRVMLVYPSPRQLCNKHSLEPLSCEEACSCKKRTILATKTFVLLSETFSMPYWCGCLCVYRITVLETFLGYEPAWTLQLTTFNMKQLILHFPSCVFSLAILRSVWMCIIKSRWGNNDLIAYH